MAGEHLKTVKKMFRLLDLFTAVRPEWTVADLSRASGFPRTVVQRIIVSLEEEGYLERCGDTLRYRIGISACQLGSLYVKGNPVLQAAQEPLRALVRDTGYPVYLGTLIEAEVMILALFEGTRSIRFTWSLGDRLPVSTTALGKAMLMAMSPSALQDVVGAGALPQTTPRSLPSVAALVAQLNTQRGKGWVPACDESLSGVTAVGAAVLRSDGAPLAGVSVSFLADHDAEGQLEHMGSKVAAAAADIGRRLQLLMPYSAERVA